jgi:V/A-type H+-transporting ATPase subunit E
MANDNKLLSFIIDDGQLQAEKIIKEAQIKGEEIIRNASLQAEENAKEIEQAAENKAQSLRNIASSNASLVSRNTVLKAKREQLDRTVEGMKQYILSLDGNDYFELIYRMAKSISASGGEILLNERDLNRLPSDFEEKISAAGINAKVCKTPVGISGGFILRDGSIEMNCSVDSVIDDKRNEIEDFINESIFEQGENENA